MKTISYWSTINGPISIVVYGVTATENNVNSLFPFRHFRIFQQIPGNACGALEMMKQMFRWKQYIWHDFTHLILD